MPVKVPIGRGEALIPTYTGSDQFVFHSRLIGQVYWQHLTQYMFMTQEFNVLFLDPAGNTCCEVWKANWIDSMWLSCLLIVALKL